MTNALVGDVYQKIIEAVIDGSRQEFEENGVSIATLNELQQEWRVKLSAKGVAQMPWDPKPLPPPIQQAPPPALAPSTNGLQPQYGYNPSSTGPNGGGPPIKHESGSEAHHSGGLPNYAPQQQQPTPTQGGFIRAQQLVQQVQQYGSHQAQGRGGLALPGQRPQGLQLPGNNPAQQQYAQQQYAQQQRQQAALQQQQTQPRIKVENESPQVQQGGFQQQQPRQPNPAYSQTDGADDGLEEWQNMLAERRAVSAEQTQRAERMMRDHILQHSSDLQSGLMVPLDEQPNNAQSKKRRVAATTQDRTSATAGPSVPQLDGDVDDDDEKPDRDELDEDAINSDLDSDNDDAGGIGDDDDDFGDTILCTYDKVQRVKNKWKCTLKDGVMSIKGKEWVFHKGMGEFEW